MTTHGIGRGGGHGEHDLYIRRPIWSSIMVGQATDGNQGPDMAGHAFPEGARARKAGTMSLPTTHDQTFRYAGESGDRRYAGPGDDIDVVLKNGWVEVSPAA